ncbi:carboxypeptidase-like regulatory domain-containing protein [Niabella ginsengisoli]|uniref:Carboxypeptidase-like regulatory domain-containing protein n=1 Tax=Niabella ginsengisoli TaxID=522298 RepID=A0ABS9SPZ2_9BACT|nr:carboxypeptidase-like regulatory domain-containing protein [Niabella ginsengisoli]MCH5600429.1 carboxypeptidase-like regulatory domain-containing protein [Niabella ginsengisoli]
MSLTLRAAPFMEVDSSTTDDAVRRNIDATYSSAGSINISLVRIMRILLIVFIALIPSLLFAQQDTSRAGSITGIVKDSADDYTLQSVTITLYKKADSSLLAYQITGEDGSFNLTDIPFFTPVYINFSFTGYSPFSKNITLDTANRFYNFKNVMLPKSQGLLDEVVVKAVVPITMNGDTLEINPGAFKLDSNAVVEDMLRRVPGVTMWGDGTITVNGKTVNNVFVDGKPFLVVILHWQRKTYLKTLLIRSRCIVKKIIQKRIWMIILLIHCLR